MEADAAIVGAGAAGLMAAIVAAEAAPGGRVVLLDGAARPGAKILVSGGGRCNVTNDAVEPADFNTGSPAVLRRVLAAFPAARARRFFEETGVALKAEPGGKLFPTDDRARSVLEALLGRAARAGVELRAGWRVAGVERRNGGFLLEGPAGALEARRVVLATGGRSLPKTGSDGAGYAIAASLGHSLLPTVPALAPLVLEGDWHVSLAGLSLPVELTLRVDGRAAVRREGPMLFTHFGVSGPAPMNLCRHWELARASGRAVAVEASFLPGRDFEAVDRALVEAAAAAPARTPPRALAEWIPERLAAALAPPGTLASLKRDDRRALVRALTARPLPVARSRGWNYAEATAGGVPLTEVDPRTLESRRTPGLYLAGEILDVDGRIGGFNFQWAWSSGFVAGRAAALNGPAPRATVEP
jgi:hypothetical protein